MAVARDITERKGYEEELREREEQYRALIETIPHGIQENDIDGKDRERSADLAGTIGASYDVPINDNWTLGLNGDIRYSDDYLLEPCICSAKATCSRNVASVGLFRSDARQCASARALQDVAEHVLTKQREGMHEERHIGGDQSVNP